MGLIYKITNCVNGKSYIGKTSVTLEYRLKKHKESALIKDTKFYRAVRKYGWQNFKIEVLQDNILDSEIDERERYWISYYNTFKEGYNSTIGGEGGRRSTDDEIISLWESGYNITEIVELCHSTKDTVRSVLNKNNVDHSIIEERRILNRSNNYDKNKVLELWNNGKTTREIREHFCGMGQGTLLKILDELGITTEERASRKEKEVTQYSLDGNFIQSFKSVKEAHNMTGISYDGIRKAATGIQNTSGGFIWKYT